MSILDDLVDHLDGATKYERYISACCPFHGDSHPSLLVYEDRFYCQACGERGSTTSLLRKMRGHIALYASDDGDELRNPFFKWLRYDSLLDVMKRAWDRFNNYPDQGSYITHKRKIDPAVRRSIGIGHLESFYTFPIWQGRQLAGAFVRAPEGSPSRYFIPKGQDPNLVYFPQPRLLLTQGVVFVTFGGIDAISVSQLGFAACSTTTGKRIDPSAFDEVRKPLIFLPDYGEEEDAYRIASQLGWRGSVLILDYPRDCKDPNDFYRYNKDELRDALLCKVERCYA